MWAALAFASMRTLITALCALIACGPSSRDDVGGGNGHHPDAAGTTGNNGCADGTELIYTIDQFNYRLSRFDPSTKTFQDLGSLTCPAMNGATPFSMSVDR